MFFPTGESNLYEMKDTDHELFMSDATEFNKLLVDDLQNKRKFTFDLRRNKSIYVNEKGELKEEDSEYEEWVKEQEEFKLNESIKLTTQKSFQSTFMERS